MSLYKWFGLVITTMVLTPIHSSVAGALRGTVSIDGSSTVYPMSEAVAEQFLSVQPRVRVTVGVSGTGGGFNKFLSEEIDINDASRPIKHTEQATAKENDIRYIELPVAFDGLSIVVNRDNDWVDYLTVEQLKLIWQPGSSVKYWSDVNVQWPKTPIRLYGPGTDSGTFDYFTEVINGKSGASRADYTASEDDNMLVRGVSSDKNALGFFGYAYYSANKDKLKLVAIDGGRGPVLPSPSSINNGSYSPLSRPMFIYVNARSLKRPEVKAFTEFYIDSAAELAQQVGYIGLPQSVYQCAKSRIYSATTDTNVKHAANETVDSLHCE